MKWVIYDNNNIISAIIDNETYDDGSLNIVPYSNYNIKEYADYVDPIYLEYEDGDCELCDNTFMLNTLTLFDD